ncbi:MAG: glycosyltransferase family 2 protein [Leptospirales bacterium]
MSDSLSSSDKAIYSVVIPVYNSSKIIDKNVIQICNFFKENSLDYEIVLVNDGSKDYSWDIISNMAKQMPKITAINLLKNYGQHAANLCGFRHAVGNYIITMDDDLQNPPLEIAKLINAMKDGVDLVVGQFESKQHSVLRRIGSRIVGMINRKVFDVRDGLILSNFRIIRRDVINRVCRDESFFPYIPGLLLKYSSCRKNVIVKHLPRLEGKSNYTWRKIFHLVAGILFNYSTIPLRYTAGLGFTFSVASFILGTYWLINAFIKGVKVPGWASLIVFLSFSNVILMFMLSIIGEYLIRIIREINIHQSYEVTDIVRQ